MKVLLITAKLTVSIAGLLVGGASMAQSTSWNWGSTPGCDPYTCEVNGVTATVSGWGARSATGAFELGSVNDVDPSGLGIRSKDGATTGGVQNDESISSPNHSIDNFRQNSPTDTGVSYGGADYAEVLAISFSQAVSLSRVSAAWTYTDSDAMIFRWDGTGAGTLAGVTADKLPTATGTTTNGWTLVSAGQFAIGSQYNSGATVGSLSFTSSLYSSYWLVSTALGQTSTSANNDGFKINQFMGDLCAYTVVSGECRPPPPQGVPEPGTLALAGMALLGLTVSRRRKVLAH